MHISHNTRPPAPLSTVVVFGCGNVLLGDDGFGPAVIAALADCDLPERVEIIDIGTGIREYLLDYLLLPASRPTLVIVVDAGYQPGLRPGQVQVCSPAALARQKCHDFSLHQFPTVNLLQELEQETGIQVILLLAQTASLPDLIAPGLSPALTTAVAEACQQIRLLADRHLASEARVE